MIQAVGWVSDPGNNGQTPNDTITETRSSLDYILVFLKLEKQNAKTLITFLCEDDILLAIGKQRGSWGNNCWVFDGPHSVSHFALISTFPC